MADEDLTAFDRDGLAVIEQFQFAIDGLFEDFGRGNLHDFFEGRNDVGAGKDWMLLVVDDYFNFVLAEHGPECLSAFHVDFGVVADLLEVAGKRLFENVRLRGLLPKIRTLLTTKSYV